MSTNAKSIFSRKNNTKQIPHKTVFLDPSGRRWKTALAALSLLIFLLSGIVYLIAENLSTYAQIRSSLNGNSYNVLIDRRRQTKEEVFGVYTNNRFESYVSLRENLDNLDTVFFNLLTFARGNDSSLTTVFSNNPNTEEALQYVNSYSPKLKKILTLSDINYDKGEWEPRDTSALLHDLLDQPESFSKFADEVVVQVKRNNFQGLAFDIREKGLPPEKIKIYENLLATIRTKANTEKIPVYSFLPLRNSDVFFNIHSRNSDITVISFYNKPGFDPTPITSTDENISLLYSIIRNNPDLNYYLLMPSLSQEYLISKGETVWRNALTMSDVGEIIKKYSLNINTDDTSLSSYIEYTDENNMKHKIYLADSVTLFNQLSQLTANLSKQPMALGIEQMGYEEPNSWKILNSPTQQERLQYITTEFAFDTFVDKTGRGEMYRILNPLQYGTRQIRFDAGKIVSQSISSFPKRMKIERFGYKDKKIVLTFDDGPDPNYTPKILDILNDKGVKAAFFVIGENSAQNPDILNRIVNEGHTLGNHTWSHPRTHNLDSSTLNSEITSTTNIIREVTNTTPRYFRTPFRDTDTIYTLSDVNSIEIINRNGLIPSEYDVDSKDWETKDKDQILERILTKIDTDGGSQILLHDGGDYNREATVDALPLLIDELRKRGYQIVSLEQMEDNFDFATASRKIFSTQEFLTKKIGLLLSNNILGWLSIILLLCLCIATVRTIIFVFGVVKRAVQRSSKLLPFTPHVSVIIPCYNEQEVVCKTVDSILTSYYPNFEIIVVDDGSKDKTLEKLNTWFGSNKKVKIYSIANGGKAHALNFGISKSRYDFIVCLDADTIFAQNTIKNLMRHFQNDGVGGVAGNVQLGNNRNLLTVFQKMEYIFSQNFDKSAQEGLDCITVIPGAVGAWRKSVLLSVNGFESDTLAEDTDTTIKVLKSGYKIKYDKNAISMTEAPETLKAFFKQRFRWQYGTLQVLFKHKELMFSRSSGYLGLFTFPAMLLSYVFTLLSPLTYLVPIFYGIKYLLSLLYPIIFLWSAQDIRTIQTLVLVGGVYFVVEFILYTYAIFVDKTKHKVRLILLYPIQILIYRQLLWFVTVSVIFRAVKGSAVGWGHLKRTGNVSLRFIKRPT